MSSDFSSGDGEKKDSGPPVKDAVHQELLDAGKSAVSELPALLERISRAAENMEKEERLVRLESRRTRKVSGTKWPRLELKK